jgi:hypothetical protein
MGTYLRYKSAIGNMLSELTILVTAREWSRDYEWTCFCDAVQPEIFLRPNTVGGTGDQ